MHSLEQGCSHSTRLFDFSVANFLLSLHTFFSSLSIASRPTLLLCLQLVRANALLVASFVLQTLVVCSCDESPGGCARTCQGHHSDCFLSIRCSPAGTLLVVRCACGSNSNCTSTSSPSCVCRDGYWSPSSDGTNCIRIYAHLRVVCANQKIDLS